MSESSVGAASGLPHAPNGTLDVLVETGKTYWWCACGLSKSQPFCDGSHKGSGFSPLAYKATESGMRHFCGCKRSSIAPLCDGAHVRCANNTAET